MLGAAASMVSKITSKGQITLPKKVRDKLGVRAGDYLAYEVAGNTVKLRKAQPLDLPWLRAVSRTLAPEWDSSYDHENFDDL
ncbi:MAG: AbrB/MazE/SpoVT family DNA-binding domain-containing protein [Bryobacteraceae bacterium]|jgi:AbrB family looped-hinge helix DNA binding protein